MIAYWPLDESSGLTADNAEGTAARDATYSGVTLAQSQPPFSAPLFDGVNDYVNIYSASLNTAFSAVTGSVSMLTKVFDVGVWSDFTSRALLSLRSNNDNRIIIMNSSTANRIDFTYEAGNVIEAINITGLSSTDWMHLGITWNASGNFTVYIDGVEVGTPQAIGGTWVGAFNASTTTIGAGSVTPSLPWHGYIAHTAIWTSELSASQMAELAVT